MHQTGTEVHMGQCVLCGPAPFAAVAQCNAAVHGGLGYLQKVIITVATMVNLTKVIFHIMVHLRLTSLSLGLSCPKWLHCFAGRSHCLAAIAPSSEIIWAC